MRVSIHVNLQRALNCRPSQHTTVQAHILFNPLGRNSSILSVAIPQSSRSQFLNLLGRNSSILSVAIAQARAIAQAQSLHNDPY